MDHIRYITPTDAGHEKPMIDAQPIQLPHTRDCLVCGRDNPHGLKLDAMVDPANGLVTINFAPGAHHTGFEGIVHGGLIATVMDEAMTWAASWAQKRFCVCGEVTVRFRQAINVGQTLRVEAMVEFSRPKLVEPSAKLFDEHHKLLATASGKYVPTAPEQHRLFAKSFVPDPRTREAANLLGVRDAG
ncbi:MAG: PaaI family thioesterase [Tepidisphaeraceae bacterium]